MTTEGGAPRVERLRLEVPSALLGRTAQVEVARPVGAWPEPLPWCWLLHGWGNTIDDVAWQVDGLAEQMAAGDLAPYVVAGPAGPWSETAWWVDSTHAGGDPVESAVLTDLLPEVERRLGGPAGRDARVVTGSSMGGAGALGWLLRRPDLFGAAALVAPAAFADAPPREAPLDSGAFGVGDRSFDPARWRDLMDYGRQLDRRTPASPPARVAIVVGDAEEVEDYPPPLTRSSLTLEAARLHVALADAPGVGSALRVVGGGHTWDFWIPALVRALTLVDPRAQAANSR